MTVVSISISKYGTLLECMGRTSVKMSLETQNGLKIIDGFEVVWFHS